ncbi:MAG TPA: hypothetical protein VK002_05815 [Rubricoccaceae bacterium]|nr:hypothetical protein [Rubricoccaceae bacterium]
MPDAPPPDDRREDAPDADDAPEAPKKAAHAGGFTLDLSSGPAGGQPEAWRRKRKQASPILTKIVDLTAPKPEPVPPRPEEPAPKSPPVPPRGEKAPRNEKRRDERGRGRKPGGATLADLLDEETLARLRGEE